MYPWAVPEAVYQPSQLETKQECNIFTEDENLDG